MLKRFEGKVVLVTGGGSGIGLSGALRIASEGAKGVAIVGRTEDKLKGAAEQIKKEHGVEVLLMAADVTDITENENIMQKTIDHFGRLDAVFLNAGMGKFTTLAEVDEATYDTIFNVNTKAVLFGIKAAAAAMKKAGTKGSILVTSSVLGHRVVERFATAGVYSASKAAVEMFVKYAAIEHAEDGIRVNSISPGVVFTPIQQMSEEDTDRMGAGCQLVGRAGRPEEIASCAAYMLSDEASFVTGSDFDVDGGWVLKA